MSGFRVSDNKIRTAFFGQNYFVTRNTPNDNNNNPVKNPFTATYAAWEIGSAHEGNNE